MLNLKTANLVAQSLNGPLWGGAVPPAPYPTSPDPEYDIGEIIVDIGPKSAVVGGPALTCDIPLRSVGGSFSIGSTTYTRPPAMGSNYLYALATLNTSGVGWPPPDQGTLYATGYINCSATILDNTGATVQAVSWCTCQAKAPDGHGGYAYGQYANGEFPTGQGTGPLGSYIVYPIIRFFCSLSFPATDFDGGTLRLSWLMSPTSNTGSAGPAAGGFSVAGANALVFKLVAEASQSPAISEAWDF